MNKYKSSIKDSDGFIEGFVLEGAIVHGNKYWLSLSQILNINDEVFFDIFSFLLFSWIEFIYLVRINIYMIDIKPFKGTRPYNEQAENLIAPTTDQLDEKKIIDIHEKNYWNYLKILNPVGKNKEAEALLAAKNHFFEMKKNNNIFIFLWSNLFFIRKSNKKNNRIRTPT